MDYYILANLNRVFGNDNTEYKVIITDRIYYKENSYE